MLKAKIIFTVFVVYEIIAVILLHLPVTCEAVFGRAFCYDSVFKYFLICVAVPLSAFVIWLWVNEVVVSRRRHRSLLRRAKNVVSDVANGFKERIEQTFDGRISTQNMDKYLATAILFGMKKYAEQHPQLRRTVRDIVNTTNGRFDYDDDFEDTESGEHDIQKRRTNTRKSTQKSVTKSRRKK